MRRNFTKELTFTPPKKSSQAKILLNDNSPRAELFFHVDSSKLLSIVEKSIVKRKFNHLIGVNGFLYINCREYTEKSKNKVKVIEMFYSLIEDALRATVVKRRMTSFPKSA